jgi:hypothetical protein
MTASEANGFAQVNFDPGAGTCSQSPYAFHPMYSTSSEHTRVPWAAHSYNVAASDEIGHFQYCSTIPVEGGDCADPTADQDDSTCFSPAFSLLVQVGGCIASNTGFDGTSYLPDWPGTNPNHGQDTKYHADPWAFSSPVFNGSENYERVAFEADMPRIEAADFGGICNRTTGENCTNPPPGAQFYPIYTTGRHGRDCFWQFGGTYLPGTTNTFGGNSTTEFGPLLQSVYPGNGFVPVFRYNNFRRIMSSNPCSA